MRRIACATLLLAATAAVSPREAEAKYCPRVLYRATRLVLVTVPNMQATEASVRTFERNSPATRWEPRGDAEPAVVSTRGIAWGDMYESLAKKGEPLKREGDQRAPAGIYRISGTFGADASKLVGYLPLVPAKQFCVEDANLRYYGNIVAQRIASEKQTSGEDIAKVPLSRLDLATNYPSRPKVQAGSCIFLHVWGAPETATDARIVLPEERVAFLQEWAAHRFAAIAIVSADTVERYKGCLPRPDTAANSGDPVTVPLPVRKSAAKRAG
jgi:D-alanyl-D-alanine dipeptidase